MCSPQNAGSPTPGASQPSGQIGNRQRRSVTVRTETRPAGADAAATGGSNASTWRPGRSSVSGVSILGTNATEIVLCNVPKALSAFRFATIRCDLDSPEKVRLCGSAFSSCRFALRHLSSFAVLISRAFAMAEREVLPSAHSARTAAIRSASVMSFHGLNFVEATAWTSGIFLRPRGALARVEISGWRKQNPAMALRVVPNASAATANDPPSAKMRLSDLTLPKLSRLDQVLTMRPPRRSTP